MGLLQFPVVSPLCAHFYFCSHPAIACHLNDLPEMAAPDHGTPYALGQEVSIQNEEKLHETAEESFCALQQGNTSEFSFVRDVD